MQMPLEKQNSYEHHQESSPVHVYSIATPSSVLWIYMAQFWHTSKEDRSKYRLKFMLDKKELNLTLDDCRTNPFDNNGAEDHHPSSKTTMSFCSHGKRLCAQIFSKCYNNMSQDVSPIRHITENANGCINFVYNIHVDYAELNGGLLLSLQSSNIFDSISQ
ncbi:hypothetical protein Tco_1507319 [Tanacetum coccineum]